MTHQIAQAQARSTGESDKDVLKITPFGQTLSDHGLRLERDNATTLQINIGFACNQTCLHCHLNAGPGRKENMLRETVDDVISYASKCDFETIDITGGAPELNPHLKYLIQNIATLAPRIMLRSNLTLLNTVERNSLIELLKSTGTVIVASFPSINETQYDSQRGTGYFQVTLDTLRKLNKLGYGQKESGLELNLVSNPTGAFLSPSQEQMEKRFRQILQQKWGIKYNNLYNFANVPLGRFRSWLKKTGNMEKYMDKLVSGFNSCAVEGVMCRTLVSVAWDGYLYDCDFNLAKGIPIGGAKTHVSEMSGPPEPGSLISVGDHCYTCTAGSGFT